MPTHNMYMTTQMKTVYFLLNNLPHIKKVSDYLFINEDVAKKLMQGFLFLYPFSSYI